MCTDPVVSVVVVVHLMVVSFASIPLRGNLVLTEGCGFCCSHTLFRGVTEHPQAYACAAKPNRDGCPCCVGLPPPDHLDAGQCWATSTPDTRYRRYRRASHDVRRDSRFGIRG
eukprot:1183523-Prorocentrum_minimum.AAC.3